MTTAINIRNIYRAGLDDNRLKFCGISYDLLEGKSLFNLSRGFSLRPKKVLFLLID
jgi:hypothetical protein